MFFPSLRQPRHQAYRPATRGHRATRRSQVLNFRPRLDAFEDRTLLAVKTWIGGAFQDVCQGIRSGDPNAWSNPLNWLGGLPGPADTAAFVDRILVATCPGGDVFGPFTTNAVVDAAFAGLVAGINSGWAGTITLARELTLTTNSVWSSGDIAGGTLTNTGTLAVSGGRLFGATLNNANRINHTGGTFTLAADNGVGGTLVNQAAAVYDFVGDGAIQGAGAAAGTSRTFVNQGMLRKSEGDGTSILEGSTNGITFNSSGLIEVQVGTLRVASGGLSTGGMYTVWWDEGVLDLSPATSHAYQGTFYFDGPVQLNSGTFDVTGGFQLAGGDFQWQGGEVFGGRWENKAYVLLDGAGDKTLRRAVLINHYGGGIAHYGGRLVLAAENGVGGTVENLPEASYNANGDTPVAIVGSGVGGGNSRTFINRGYFTKYDVGTFTVAGGSEGVTFHNSGELYAYEGTIRINAGGTFTGGRYDASGGGVIDLAGSATYEGTLTGGGGRVQLRGTMTIGPAGVTLQLPFYWQGGTITGGTLTNAGGLTLEGGDLTLHRAVLNNTAQIIHASGNLILSAENGVGGTLVNLSGAAYFADANGGGVSGTGVGGGTSRTFVNQGSTLRRSQAGPGTFTFAGGASGVNLDNSGYVEARSGTLAAANVAQITGTTLTGGTWTVRNATTLNLADGRGLTVNNANVTLDGVGANFVNLSSLAVNGGSLSLVNEGAGHTLQGGTRLW